MNREEFIKHQEDMINELFPPEHRREVAEYAQDMLADACKEMERWHGKDWKENAQSDYDPKTAFLEELQVVLRKHNACIWVQCDQNNSLVISLNGDEYVVPEMYGVNADNIDIIKNKI